MLHQGHISLYKEDEIIATKFYKCLVERNRIINMWRAIYGKGFKGCAVHISPVPGEETKADGTNKNFYPDRTETGRMCKNVWKVNL